LSILYTRLDVLYNSLDFSLIFSLQTPCHVFGAHTVLKMFLSHVFNIVISHGPRFTSLLKNWFNSFIYFNFFCSAYISGLRHIQ
jgi:hypothetical protein